MLTVWCVFNGNKYSEQEVRILRDQVERHYTGPHTFICLSDRKIDGVNCFIPQENWPGWWAKLLLFRYSQGACLYLDLDCVVVGNLGSLLSQPLSMPQNWAQSGFGGCQSSVMAWYGNGYGFLAEDFRPEDLKPPADGDCGRYHGLWGDQEYITRKLGAPGVGNVAAMQGVYSYKYHCGGGPPDDAVVVAFHGSPKPSEVSAQWVKNARYT